MNNTAETISPNDSNLLSRSAAEALNTSPAEKIKFHRKSGWFITKWQAVTIVIATVILFFIGFYTGKSSIMSNREVRNIIIKDGDNAQNNSYLTNNIENGINNTSYYIDKSESTLSSSKTIFTFISGNDEKNSTIKYLIQPLHYNIYIKPFFHEQIEENNEKFTFKGNVSIFLHCREKIKNIVIGANNLRVTSTKLRKLNHDKENQVIDIIDLSIDSYNMNDGTLGYHVHKSLIPNAIYVLEIAFHGNINDLSYGLFQSIHKNAIGEIKWLIGTNFDVPFARTAFPCFDIPTITSTYEINIARENNMTILTNALRTSSTTEDNSIWEKFLIQTAISVQKLAFAITTFYSKSINTHDVHLTIWQTSIKHEEIEYALEIGVKLLQNIRDYFQTNTSDLKINIFCLDKPFSPQKTKMGIIYISQSDLWYTEGKTSVSQKEKVTMTLTHHLLEHWIENFVTFKWSDEKWIKISLIQQLQYSIIGSIDSTFKVTNKFYMNVQQIEMQLEERSPIKKPFYKRWIPILEHSKINYNFPVNDTLVFKKIKYSDNFESNNFKKITNPNVYDQLYEYNINNNKGACLFYMLQYILTESVFKSALRSFLEISKEKPVEAKDLWNVMSLKARNLNNNKYQLLPEDILLEAVVDDWIYSNGYPVLTVERNYKENFITFSQFNENMISRYSPYTTRKLNLFYIPISYTTEHEKNFFATAPKIWLKKVKKLKVETDANLTNNTWLLVNPQGTGFYRVNYDERNWRMLNIGIKNGDFPDIIRAQLLDNALYFDRAGFLNNEIALDFISFFSEFTEKEYTVWTVILRHLNFMRILITDTNISKIFKKYVNRLIKPVFNHLNSKYLEKQNLDQNDRLLRSDIFLWACAVGISECRTKARSEFDKWKQSAAINQKSTIDPDLHYAILCTIMQFGGSSDYYFLHQTYLSIYDTDPNNDIYFKSLFCCKNIKPLQIILSETLENNHTIAHVNKVKKIWTTATESFYNSEIYFDHLLNNWEALKLRYGEFKTVLQEIVTAATRNIQNNENLEKLKKFQMENMEKLPYLHTILHDAIRHAEEKLYWKNERMNLTISWMKKKLIDNDDDNN